MLDELGDRMKGYEKIGTFKVLNKYEPVIVRLDGKAFHSYTKGMQKPFAPNLIWAFEMAIIDLHEKVHFDIAYHQSDEVTLVFLPKEETSELPFGGKLSKLNSILASMFTLMFNDRMAGRKGTVPCSLTWGTHAYFDCRCFNVPDLDEATNAIYWRMLDAIRNSVSMLAQSKFSHKQLHGVSHNQKIAMLNGEWENLPLSLQQGQLLKPYVFERCYDDLELNGLPLKHYARQCGVKGPLTIARNHFGPINAPKLVSQMTHLERMAFYFNKEETRR